MDNLLFQNDKVYVIKEEYDDLWSLYIKEIEESRKLSDENEQLKKENTRLKRLERRQQRRWEEENK